MNNNKRFAEKPSKKIGYDVDNNVDFSQHIPVVSEPNSMENVDKPEIKKKKKTMTDRKLKITGMILLALFFISLFLAPRASFVNISEEATQAMESGMSIQLPIGTRILTEDENLAGQDLTITHSSQSDESKIHIWDYAAEDGDYVQILVDGTAIGDPFMIRNKPVVCSVPTTGEILVLGTRDGGGGITYAVHYELNGTTYFNGTNVGDGNLYTLIKE